MKRRFCFIILSGIILYLSLFSFLLYTIGICASSRFRDVAETDLRQNAIRELNRYHTEYDHYVLGLINQAMNISNFNVNNNFTTPKYSNSTCSNIDGLTNTSLNYFNHSIICPHPIKSAPSIAYLTSSSDSLLSSYSWTINKYSWLYKQIENPIPLSDESINLPINLLKYSTYDTAMGNIDYSSVSHTWSNIKDILSPRSLTCDGILNIANHCWLIDYNQNNYYNYTDTITGINLNCPQQENPQTSIIHLFQEQFSKAIDILLSPVDINSNSWLCPSDSVTLSFLPFLQIFRYKIKLWEWYQINFIDGLRGKIASSIRIAHHHVTATSLLSEFLQLDSIRNNHYNHIFIIDNYMNNTLCVLPPYSNDHITQDCYLLSDISYDIVINASIQAVIDGTYPLPMNKFIEITNVWKNIFQQIYNYEMYELDNNIQYQVVLRSEVLDWIISVGIFSFASLCTLFGFLWVLITSIRAEDVAESRAALLENKTRTEHAITSYLCHELRNPLHGIISSLELLEDSEKDYEKSLQYVKSREMYRSNTDNHDKKGTELSTSKVNNLQINLSMLNERKEILSSINTCVGQMLAIANDMLDLTKLTEGKLFIRYSHSSLGKLLREIQISYRHWSQVPIYTSPLRRNTPPILPLPKERLMQILSNGLSNAIKHTKEGFIFLVAEWIPASNYVEYNGITMNPFCKEFSNLPKSLNNEQLYVLYEGKKWYTKAYNRKLAEEWAGSDRYLPSLSKNHDDNTRFSVPIDANLSTIVTATDTTASKVNSTESNSTATTRFASTTTAGSSDSNRSNTTGLQQAIATEASITLEIGDFAQTILHPSSNGMITEKINDNGSSSPWKNVFDSKVEHTDIVVPIPEDTELLNGLPGTETRVRKNSITTQAHVSGALYDGAILFSVIDTGVGLLTENPESLFEAFTSFTGGQGSTGLGLGLSRHLARTMNGDAWLENATEKDYAMCARFLEVRQDRSPDSIDKISKRWLTDYRKCTKRISQNSSPCSSTDSNSSPDSYISSKTPKVFINDTSNSYNNPDHGAVFRVILPVCNFGTPAYNYLESLESHNRPSRSNNQPSPVMKKGKKEKETMNKEYAGPLEQRVSFAATHVTNTSDNKSLVTASSNVSDPRKVVASITEDSAGTDSSLLGISTNPLLLQTDKVEIKNDSIVSSSSQVLQMNENITASITSNVIVEAPVLPVQSNIYNPALPTLSPSISIPKPQELKVSVNETIPAIIRPRVLLVEDDEVNRRIGTRHLIKLGYRSETMNDGVGVLERIIAAEKENDPFAIILTDIVMERMSGGALVKYIRESGRSMEQLPVIAVTGNAGLDYERDSLRQLGFNDILWKPYRQADLKLILEKHIPATTPETKSTSTISSNTPRSDRDFPIDTLSETNSSPLSNG